MGGIETHAGALRAAALIGIMALAGCGEQQLSALPVQTSIAAIAGNPYFQKADGASFTNADVTYAATGGPTRIPVGDYMLEKVIEAFGPVPASKGVERIALEHFTGDCKASGSNVFATGINCQGSVTIKVTVAGRVQELQAAVPGRFYGAQQSAIFGSDGIEPQVRHFVDDLVLQLAYKIAQI